MSRAILCQLILCAAFSTVSADTYYVSPAGDDGNSGASESEAFRVVQHAVDQMNSGDTLVVMDGVYAGELKPKSGITLKAKNPRKAVFSGAEPVKARFDRHSGNIYKGKVSGSPKQLFYNDQPMTWARWPNATWAENWIAEKKWAKATQAVAEEMQVLFIDLHTSSIAHHNKIGPEASMAYNYQEGDKTHFNKKGGQAITDLILPELKQVAPELKSYLKEPTIGGL